MNPESVGPWIPGPQPAPRRHRAGRTVFWVLFALAGACLVGGLAGVIATGPDYTVPSPSMELTIQLGDRVFVARGQDVRRGDIVVFNVPAGTPEVDPGLYVKRLIGLPGDHVACCNAAGEVTVNGKALNESQYLYPGDSPSRIRFSVTLGPDEIWVMGDNRNISLDSRYWQGNILKQDIVGRVYMIGHGTSFTLTSTPSTFIADGLAPSGGRVTWPLVCAAIAGVALIVVILLGIFGVIRSSIRRRRQRGTYRQAVLPGRVP